MISPGAQEERVLRFVEMAHEQCYIAKKDGYVKVVLDADRSQP